MSYKDGGYYQKYQVTRTDGQPFVDAPDEFIVMCFKRDKFASMAVLMYAMMLMASNENTEFALGLLEALSKHIDIDNLEDAFDNIPELTAEMEQKLNEIFGIVAE